jgi:NAD-dependent deacetylase
VYPAAGLIDYVPPAAPIYLVDPNQIPVPRHREVDFIMEKASKGLPILTEKLLKRFVDQT